MAMTRKGLPGGLGRVEREEPLKLVEVWLSRREGGSGEDWGWGLGVPGLVGEQRYGKGLDAGVTGAQGGPRADPRATNPSRLLGRKFVPCLPGSTP